MHAVRTALIGLLSIVLSATSVFAETFGFHRISNNASQNVANQFFVDVDDPMDGTVKFTFRNEGPIPSTISEVYFDDADAPNITNLATPIVLMGSAGVAFAVPATPADLPGGKSITPPFVTTTGFSADADPPPAQNGIDPGESLMVIFNLNTGKTFADVISALKKGFTSPDATTLRIGIHVISIGDDEESDSFIATPEPSGLVMLTGGGLVLATCLWRRSRRTT